MRFSRRVLTGAGVLFVAATAALALAVGASGNHSDDRAFGAVLNGWQEVPSISTTGHGTFRARLRSDRIEYRLSYAGLESAAQAAHIHLGQARTNGGVLAFLCGGGGKPACPASGAVEGTIVAADVLAIPAQGIAAGELAEVLRAIRAGAVYANVHTTTFGGGEIRGQLRGHHEDNGNGKNGKKDKDKDRDKDDDD